MANEETKPAAEAPKAGGSKLMPIMMGVNMLLIAGVLALVLIRTGGAKAATSAKPSEKSEKKEGGEGEKKEGEHGEAKAEKKEGGEGEKKEKNEGEKKEGGEGHAEKAPTAPAGSPTVKIPDFTVRLRNPEADRYARITFEMAVAGETDKSSLEAHLPQLRDAFISYLSDRTLEELRGSEGIEKTKIALMEKLPTVAPGAKVLAIYVTDMVVQ